MIVRHMVAARYIKSGELIMEDEPLTYGPLSSSGVAPLCLGCYKSLSGRSRGRGIRCQGCGWPVCSEKCAQRPAHRDLECRLFSEAGVKVDVDNFVMSGEPEVAYSCISPLRGLILKDKDPEKFSLIWGLMSHNEARRAEDYWVSKHGPIIKYIRETMGLTQFSEDDIDTVLGIYLVNDFEINGRIEGEEFASTGGNDSVRGLYQIASIPNHNCIANASHIFTSLDEGFRMIVTACRDIAEGEDITHSYVEVQEPFLARQELLKMGKFFKCCCPRCSDPTELQTYSSALLCPAPKCRQVKGGAPVITKNVKDILSDWSCTNCNKLFPVSKISNVCGAIKEHGQKLEYTKERAEECGIDAHEAFLKKYKPVLHPNHVILIRAKYSLAKMYGRMEGYEANNLSLELLERKRQLCEEVLGVLDVIMPGSVRMRGVMLYELHLPYVMIANRQLQAGPGGGADPAKICANLKKGLKYLKQGIEILKLQPENSFEAKIVAGAKDSLVELENWVKTITQALK